MSSLARLATAGLCLAQAYSASATPVASVDAIRVDGQTKSIPLLKSFVSFSIEFAFFPDYAGEQTYLPCMPK